MEQVRTLHGSNEQLQSELKRAREILQTEMNSRVALLEKAHMKNRSIPSADKVPELRAGHQCAAGFSFLSLDVRGSVLRSAHAMGGVCTASQPSIVHSPPSNIHLPPSIVRSSPSIVHSPPSIVHSPPAATPEFSSSPLS
eukprot:1191720-Prorocentrum_minimum.AAC.3